MVLGAVFVRVAAIPFWSEAVGATAVVGVNAAVFVITLAISTRYDTHIVWGTGLSAAEPATLAATIALSRIGAAAIAWGAAILCQVLVLLTGPGFEPSDASLFGRSAAAVALWLPLVLVPWSVLSRLALGRLAAPWAVLALVVLGAWITESAKGPAIVMRWVVPPVPAAAGTGFLAEPVSWVYALLHAAAVTLVASLLLRRARPD